jgi:hypothetical protein
MLIINRELHPPTRLRFCFAFFGVNELIGIYRQLRHLWLGGDLYLYRLRALQPIMQTEESNTLKP